ncbi:MAG: DUF3276 family protein [Chitinophagales bacterium]
MENNSGKYSGYFSKKLRAGKRRTYFFDVRSTKQGDFFLTITESKKKFEGEGYDSHKIFLYKEDFKKFLEALNETVNYIKTDLMPEYDYESERPAKPAGEFSEDGVEHTNHKPAAAASSENTTGSSEVQGNGNSAISDDEEIDWN